MRDVLARVGRVWRGFRAHGFRVTVRSVFRRFGIRLIHYHWVQERPSAGGVVRAAELPADLQFTTFGAQDLGAIAALDAPLHEVNGGLLERAVARGDLCVGIRRGNEIVALSVCSLDETHNRMHPVRMQPNEAYLWMMYVSPSCRGQNLAAILRQQCYDMLSALGHDTCYSITLTDNHASARFKQKLGAQVLFRGVYLKVGTRDWRWVVRRYAV